MGDVCKAKCRASLCGPAFDLGPFHLDGVAALPADEVMMVLVAGATAVAGLAVVAAQRVELTGVGQGAYLVVDGGKRDVLALCLELGVELLH